MMNGKLVTTGNDHVPFQTNLGVVSRRVDMTITSGGKGIENSASGFCWWRQHPSCSWWRNVSDINESVFITMPDYGWYVGGSWPYWLRHGRNISWLWEKCDIEIFQIRNTIPLQGWRLNNLRWRSSCTMNTLYVILRRSSRDFIYVKKAKDKSSVISYLRVPRVRNFQCKYFHARLYPCQQPQKG